MKQVRFIIQSQRLQEIQVSPQVAFELVALTLAEKQVVIIGNISLMSKAKIFHVQPMQNP